MSRMDPHVDAGLDRGKRKLAMPGLSLILPVGERPGLTMEEEMTGYKHLVGEDMVAEIEQLEMTTNDLNHLRSIHQHLREFRSLIYPRSAGAVLSRSLVDDIGWLDRFIEKHGLKEEQSGPPKGWTPDRSWQGNGDND